MCDIVTGKTNVGEGVILEFRCGRRDLYRYRYPIHGTGIYRSGPLCQTHVSRMRQRHPGVEIRRIK